MCETFIILAKDKHAVKAIVILAKWVREANLVGSSKRQLTPVQLCIPITEYVDTAPKEECFWSHFFEEDYRSNLIKIK